MNNCSTKFESKTRLLRNLPRRNFIKYSRFWRNVWFQVISCIKYLNHEAKKRHDVSAAANCYEKKFTLFGKVNDTTIQFCLPITDVVVLFEFRTQFLSSQLYTRFVLFYTLAVILSKTITTLCNEPRFVLRHHPNNRILLMSIIFLHY